MTAHLVIAHSVFTPDTKIVSETSLIEQKSPNILNNERPNLATIKNTTKCGTVEASLEGKLDIIGEPQVSQDSESRSSLPRS